MLLVMRKLSELKWTIHTKKCGRNRDIEEKWRDSLKAHWSHALNWENSQYTYVPSYATQTIFSWKYTEHFSRTEIFGTSNQNMQHSSSFLSLLFGAINRFAMQIPNNWNVFIWTHDSERISEVALYASYLVPSLFSLDGRAKKEKYSYIFIIYKNLRVRQNTSFFAFINFFSFGTFCSHIRSAGIISLTIIRIIYTFFFLLMLYKWEFNQLILRNEEKKYIWHHAFNIVIWTKNETQISSNSNDVQ